MTQMSVDIETYCDLDIKKVGAYRYAEHESFDILITAFAFDDEPVQVLSEENQHEFFEALQSPDVIKTAHNANFERVCFSHYYGIAMPPEQWRCTMVDSTRIGLPASLAQIADVLKLDEQKDASGKQLITYFSKPCKPTKTNGGRTRNLPEHNPEKWQEFIDYCVQDVETERAIRKRIDEFPVPTSEQKLWALDQRINDKGVRVDAELMDGAIVCDKQTKEDVMQRARQLTGLDNPNSPTQLLKWLQEQGVDIENLKKESVDVMLEHYTSGVIHEVLKLRQELSKSSVKKYDRMKQMVCEDERVRGILQFYGASKTGRWAGRGVQVHNLTKNYMSLSRIRTARKLVKEKDFEGLDLIYNESRQNILSQLVRTCFIPSDGYKFVISDFSAIEARVIAWLAGEQWRLDVFNTHGKIYEASAAQMFKIPVESISKGSPERQKGKVAELALGYQGGPGALINMGALNMGMEESDLRPLVDKWREANPNIKNFWYACDQAALTAVKDKKIMKTHGLTFRRERGFLFIDLPSGRSLAYAKPHITENKFGREAVAHYGLNDKNKWVKIDAYGGKWVENIVQAVSRDILGIAIERLNDIGYSNVMHVHDEVVLEVPEDDTEALEKVEKVMGEPVSWAEGLPLAADGFEAEFYMKD
ncbi:DNA polymerase [Salimicrobium halophilum]|uniref:DNA-directed DNA polymerase n=1 Tax=Salimicrobium halophilum TaxID=86666 RepID=A0A1G8WH28_9BACI|nr:DNA polymerase [Salimicrobium halophilum]SDJ76820.1 DNA polymerase [Salimicrobium halophilum]